MVQKDEYYMIETKNFVESEHNYYLIIDGQLVTDPFQPQNGPMNVVKSMENSQKPIHQKLVDLERIGCDLHAMQDGQTEEKTRLFNAYNRCLIDIRMQLLDRFVYLVKPEPMP